MERLLTCEEVSEKMNGVAPATIKSWARAGKFPAPKRLGGQCYRWDPQAIQDYIDQHGVPDLSALDRDDLMHYQDVAEILAVSPQTVANWARKGKFPEPTRIPGYRPFWTRDQVETYIASL